MVDALEAHVLVPGAGEGMAAVLEPLSFWGGVDPSTGTVVDRLHPARGLRLTGRVLVMSHGSGSSSSASLLAEMIRLGTGPAAIVLGEPDGVLLLGAAVANDLYDTNVPIVVLSDAPARIPDGAEVAVSGSEVRVRPSEIDHRDP